jgi:hypothetical protein
VAPLSGDVSLLRVPVLTDGAANLLERVVRRQALYRGAELRVDGVDSFHFTRPVDDHRDAGRLMVLGPSLGTLATMLTCAFQAHVVPESEGHEARSVRSHGPSAAGKAGAQESLVD